MEESDAAGSWIPLERTEPRVPAAAAVTIALLAAGGVIAFLAIRIAQEGAAIAAEQRYVAGATLHARFTAGIGLSGARLLSAFAAGAAVLLVWLVGRRLWHNEATGVTAAILFALNPWLLVQGSLALPGATLVMFGLLALWMALGPRDNGRWVAGAALAAGALIDLRFTAWGAPLLALLLFRGNIYAASQHLRTALLQLFALPAGAALLVVLVAMGGVAGDADAGNATFAGDEGLGGDDTLLRVGANATATPASAYLLPDCFAPRHVDVLTLGTVADYGGGHLPVMPALSWLAGAAALLVLAIAAFGHVLSDVRVARLPGRVQVRLPHALPRRHGRVLWLLLLVVAAPVTGLWVPLLALALAGGVAALGEDAPGFGATLLVGLLALAVMLLVQHWGGVAGTADITARLMPWTQIVACG